MREQDIDLVQKLSPGAHAFVNQQRVVFLDFFENPDAFLAYRVEFNMGRLGKGEERIVLEDQHAEDIDLVGAFNRLKPENQQIILGYARQKFLQEGEIIELANGGVEDTLVA